MASRDLCVDIHAYIVLEEERHLALGQDEEDFLFSESSHSSDLEGEPSLQEQTYVETRKSAAELLLDTELWGSLEPHQRQLLREAVEDLGLVRLSECCDRSLDVAALTTIYSCHQCGERMYTRAACPDCGMPACDECRHKCLHSECDLYQLSRSLILRGKRRRWVERGGEFPPHRAIQSYVEAMAACGTCVGSNASWDTPVTEAQARRNLREHEEARALADALARSSAAQPTGPEALRVPELLEYILALCDDDCAVMQASEVCRLWRRVARSDAVWRHRIGRNTRAQCNVCKGRCEMCSGMAEQDARPVPRTLEECWGLGAPRYRARTAFARWRDLSEWDPLDEFGTACCENCRMLLVSRENWAPGKLPALDLWA